MMGQLLDSNAAYIADRLLRIGVLPRWLTTVGDEETSIETAFKTAWDRADVVIATGGLGPTHDDRTKPVLTRFFQTRLTFREDLFDQIRGRFKHRRLGMPAINREQALFPDGAQPIDNHYGTAPGIRFERNGKLFFALPGVPQEMKAMLQQGVIPQLKGKGVRVQMAFRTLRTSGISESALFERLGPLKEIEETVGIAFLPDPAGVDIRITAQGIDEGECRLRVGKAEDWLRSRIGKYIWGTDGETIEAVVGRALREKGLKIAVAESCTGGLIANRFTDVPGSSDYFERGVVAYSNRAKTELLDVPERMIQDHGAVSAEVARAMAAGVRDKAGADVGVSATGIAGPSGGTPEKPVGLVYIGYADKDGSDYRKFIFRNDRLTHKAQTAQAVFYLLWEKLKQC